MRYILLLLLIGTIHISNGQTGHSNYFSNMTGWQNGTGYTLSNPTGQLQVDAAGVGASYQTFIYNFTQLNLTQNPYVQLRMKTSGTNVRVRIDFGDSLGVVTNAVPTNVTVAANNTFSTYTFDFTGKFSQSYPGPGTVNPSKIRSLIIYFNPGGAAPGYTGTVFMDSLRIGSDCNIPKAPKGIKFNQVGFYPNSAKVAVAIATVQDSFYVVTADKKDTVFRAILGKAAIWPHSGENVRKADFSAFTKTGTYYLSIDSGYSIPFTIVPKVFEKLGKGLLKSYYYNRASMAIVAPWGEKWVRAAGHPDNSVMVHSSAATAETPAGTIFSSTRGWYDAGDYNKYTVNAGISNYTILAMYEHFPSYFDTLNTFIPESSNNIPDILDEALWNVRWLLTMQDPKDGAVYHKLTSLNFNGNEMPAADKRARYAVFKGTAASLDFAAVMAQSARIFSKFPTALPGFSDSCLAAAKRAYDWAVAHPSATFTVNPTDVRTGTYGDSKMTDEFDWARMELYITTRSDSYYNSASVNSGTFNVPGYPNVNTLGLISLVHYRKQLNKAGYADTNAMKTKLITLANALRNSHATSQYGTAMGRASSDFVWGSNSVAGNQGLILLQAFKMTNDTTYLKAALSNLDYIMGRNGTGFSFVTGFGVKPPANPHHRISNADGVSEAIPGMVVGGPNPGQEDGCAGYPSSLPGQSFLDADCSYSTNEPAINYTAPVAYLAAGLEAIMAGATYTPEYSTPPSGINDHNAQVAIGLYPNPFSGNITLEYESQGPSRILIENITGALIHAESVSERNSVSKNIDLEKLPAGTYFVTVLTDQYKVVKKLVKQ